MNHWGKQYPRLVPEGRRPYCVAHGEHPHRAPWFAWGVEAIRRVPRAAPWPIKPRGASENRALLAALQRAADALIAIGTDERASGGDAETALKTVQQHARTAGAAARAALAAWR